MSDFENAKHRVAVQDAQAAMDKQTVFELEQFYGIKIRQCGILFAHSPDSLNFNGVAAALKAKLNDDLPVIYRIEICPRPLFEKVEGHPGQAVDELLIPVTFVNVWYRDPEQE